ncbi:MAG: leucine-rich repeat protein [Muribaculaceae bacterium]|nr:leucine-rich repeat protein [Muribaculaceae bacterium]
MKRLMIIIWALFGLAAVARQTHMTDDGKYEYMVNGDQLTATIVNYYGSSDEVTIPQVIDGLLVTDIGEAAFFNKGLTGTLVIPSGVRHIGLDAFNANHGLTRVDIPASVSYIHPDAFTYCDGVFDVYLYHVYPNITEPPLFHELDWADPTASNFAGSNFTIIHLMSGTIDAHKEGSAPSNNVAIRKWLEQNSSSVVDDIELPTTISFEIDATGFGVVYSTTGWTVPSGVTAQAIVWDDITTTNRDGDEDEEIDTPTQLMHYGWDADNPWIIDVEHPQHQYAAGETVPMGCGVLVKGAPGSYTAQLDYDAGRVPFRNLLHGRDFPCVADFPSPATDPTVSLYRHGALRNGSQHGFLWETFITHNTAQDQWTQDNGAPFVAEAGHPWLDLTSDNGEGNLGAPQDAHYYLTFSKPKPTSVDSVKAEKATDDNWTDLLGRHFDQQPTVAGIYIHHGKKIIIK